MARKRGIFTSQMKLSMKLNLLTFSVDHQSRSNLKHRPPIPCTITNFPVPHVVKKKHPVPHLKDAS
uniref:Ovule protein n=1 Tax=Romanomermis culicivorax TaxID=13658 RepID=A0A915L9H4_ROMCU